MSLLELLIAVMMLVIFGSTYAAVAEFTTKFMRESDEVLPGSNGLLVDQHDLQIAMDQLAETLSQPGWLLADLELIQKKGCVYDPMGGSPDVSSPGWGLPGRGLTVPPGYKFCLRSTSLAEPQSIDQLLAGAKPGIYVIQALPDRVSAAALPARRIFCRPKPFC